MGINERNVANNYAPEGLTTSVGSNIETNKKINEGAGMIQAQAQESRNKTELILSDRLGETIETYSAEVLKEQLICLAIKLKNAEEQKAEAIDCIARERKTHAESLKKFGE